MGVDSYNDFAQQIPKNVRSEFISFSLGTTMKICIVGGGNAAHTLAALFPYKGHETYVFASYADEAERLKKGCDEQGGIIANFAAENTPSGEVKGTPKVISKDAADVVPQADVLILPLPSFAYSPVLKSLKPHLRQGQFIGVLLAKEDSIGWPGKSLENLLSPSPSLPLCPCLS